MVYCQAFCVSGLRCKNNAPKNTGLCYTHNPIYCCKCELKVVNNKKCILDNCTHKFCLECIAMDIYNFQWSDDFSTEHPLMCPECDIELSDNNWQSVMDYLVVKKKLLKRKIIKTAYLSRYQYNSVSYRIALGKEYTIYDKIIYDATANFKDVTFDEIPSKVYFLKNKYTGYSNRDEIRYSFELDYDLFKKENENFHQCFIEYFYHPKRVERLGGIEWLDYN